MKPTIDNFDILEDLENEHRLIEKITGSLLWICQNINDDSKWNACLRRIEFLENFEHAIHHAKEEQILFPAFALVEIDIHSKPLHYLRQEHQESHVILQKAETMVKEKNPAIAELALELCKLTWKHIDKENSVLLREASARLRGTTLLQVNQNLKSYMQKNQARYLQLWQDGVALADEFTVLDDIPDLVRSDGCLVCDHFHNGCMGIEREWWNEHEWDDFKARNQGE